MANRRQVLQFGASVSALPLLPAGTRAMAAAIPSHQRIDAVLQDARFTASKTLARQLRVAFSGSPRWHVLEGSVSRFWMQEVAGDRQHNLNSLAGVTGEDVLFCLEQLARDKFLKAQWLHTVSPATSEYPALVAWHIA